MNLKNLSCLYVERRHVSCNKSSGSPQVLSKSICRHQSGSSFWRKSIPKEKFVILANQRRGGIKYFANLSNKLRVFHSISNILNHEYWRGWLMSVWASATFWEVINLDDALTKFYQLLFSLRDPVKSRRIWRFSSQLECKYRTERYKSLPLSPQCILTWQIIICHRPLLDDEKQSCWNWVAF